MHDRISISNICFPGTSLASDVERWRSLGARQIGVMNAKMNSEGWDQSVELLRRAAFRMATLVHPFMVPHQLDEGKHVEAAQRDLSRTLAAAKTLGAATVYMVTGGRGALSWEGGCREVLRCPSPRAPKKLSRAEIELLI